MEIARGLDKGLSRFTAISAERDSILRKLKANKMSVGKREKLVYRFNHLSSKVSDAVRVNLI